MSQHEINNKLSTITNSNRDLIIDISNDLQFINHQITKRIQSKYRKFSEKYNW